VPRLNRQDSQARTRALIVESATTLFLRDGFRATSLEDVAEHAGFTRGAAYSNFASKTALGIAAIDALYQAAEQRAIESVEAVADQDVTAWFTALAQWAQATFGDPRWARLEIEVAALAGADDGHRSATAARYTRLRKGTAQQITRAFQRQGLSAPSDLEELSLAFVSFALGLGMQRAADPSIPGRAFGVMLQRVLSATIMTDQT
jgi:AcrR family transcriptional regulator